jgi:predicted acyl esterase
MATEIELIPGINVPLAPLKSPSIKESRGTALNQRTTILRAGSRHARGAQPLACDILLQRDVPIQMRDGTVLRADIYSPADASDPLPTVLSMTPYGKSGGYWRLEMFPFRAGVPRGAVSGLQAFESPDPGHWCPHGYAVAVVDCRGAYLSEGNMQYWGTPTANDGHDVVEWLARQAWSNGRIGMSGNSQLAMIQWAIAATSKPSHLAAIAPWEGLVDCYLDNTAAGGIPFPEFAADVQQHSYGHGHSEDLVAMIRRRPLYDEYWQDKAPAVEGIATPAYVVASMTNPLHAKGTLAAFRRLDTAHRWLRIHNTMEWPDYYDPANVADLRRFFDYYLKGIENDWPQTAPVRLSVIDLGGSDTVNRTEEQWPPTGVEHLSLHLDARTATLSPTEVGQSVVSYQSDDGTDSAVFDYVFSEDTELVGYSSLRLWAHTDAGEDMDVFVRIEKLDAKGRTRYRMIMAPPFKLIERAVSAFYRRGRFKYGFIMYAGPDGRLRASHRETDPARSQTAEPSHPHKRTLPLGPAELVELHIGLWPVSMKWRAGETLRLRISGFDPRGHWFPSVNPVSTINRGRHYLHCGGDTDSVLLLPVAR